MISLPAEPEAAAGRRRGADPCRHGTGTAVPTVPTFQIFYLSMIRVIQCQLYVAGENQCVMSSHASENEILSSG
jgi:hypothetical protein